MRKTLQELRYKCRRHNTDSAIPDSETLDDQVRRLCHIQLEPFEYIILAFAKSA